MDDEDEAERVATFPDFERQLKTYCAYRDTLEALPGHMDVGWVRVDMQPIKQVLVTLARKWMWTFGKYLVDQVTGTLVDLDLFLKRTEPELERITGEERDTASFMRMMRLFNEVAAKQQDMEVKFANIRQMADVLQVYGYTLPQHTQGLYDTLPNRWSSLKSKVLLAKQRLGPRIQEESARINKVLILIRRIDCLTSF